jgi:hypothetical protein
MLFEPIDCGQSLPFAARALHDPPEVLGVVTGDPVALAALFQFQERVGASRVEEAVLRGA